jgi:magnesium transporter
VDNYFEVLDSIEDKIEILEENISLGNGETDKAAIYTLKKELLKIRKSIAPLREAINQFGRSESPLIDEKTTLFVRDVYDHIIQITDNVDSLRDILSGLQDLYISEVSLKMNKIMQFLTIVTSIFVPISFLTGLYGMNFEYIPELKLPNGYYFLWGAMLLIVSGMLIWFWRKRWL